MLFAKLSTLVLENFELHLGALHPFQVLLLFCNYIYLLDMLLLWPGWRTKCILFLSFYDYTEENVLN